MLISIIVIVVPLAVLLLAGGWLGFQIKPRRFPTVPTKTPPHTLSLPVNLPAPVVRFAHTVFGDRLPEANSAMVLGRARLAPTRMPMATRFWFYYDAARSSYYHDIRVTWFNRTFMRIHERNLEGHAILDLSFLGRVEDALRTNRAAVQGYWGEVLAWVPSIVLTDTRVRWESIDATTAQLYLPGLDDAEAFTVRFDANTGLMTGFETMRYQAESHAERRLWRNHVLEWGVVNGLRVPVRSQTQWNEDTPWATWEVEQVVLNEDVSARLAQFGGDTP